MISYQLTGYLQIKPHIAGYEDSVEPHPTRMKQITYDQVDWFRFSCLLANGKIYVTINQGQYIEHMQNGRSKNYVLSVSVYNEMYCPQKGRKFSILKGENNL